MIKKLYVHSVECHTSYRNMKNCMYMCGKSTRHVFKEIGFLFCFVFEQATVCIANM